MAVLSFKVQADYEKVARLREEIVRLEGELRNVGKNTPTSEIRALETKLAEAKGQFTALATEAAKSGAAMDAAFKDKIRAATQSVTAFTKEIAEQKARIKDIELHIQQYGDAYRKALASGSPKASSIKADLDAAKKALQEEKAALFGLTQQQASAKMTVQNLKDSYSEYKDEVKGVSEEVKDASKSQEGFNISLGKVAALVGGATALKQLASQVVRVRAEFQDMETAIETLVGKDVTSKIMPQIKEMAKVSPLTMTDIVGAEKMMLSFNIDAEKSIQYLRALSDVSMGSSQKFNSLTLAFSQMSSAGKLMGQDLLQMINAGFNPLQTISEKTGKSISQLKEEMSKGAISAEMVQQAFLDATSAGGKFYNMSENASKTINGQISMMEDAMDAVFNEIGTKTEGLIIKSIQTVTSLIQNYEKIGKVLVGLVTTYGAYRTAVLLSTAATSKHTLAEVALINVRIAARKAQMALNAAMLTNPYVALATVVAGLTATMWAMGDSSTAAERAQASLAKRNEELAEKEKDHANAIQGLITKVQDETQAESERVLALDALKKEYPKIFEQYDIEKMKLADILEIKRQISEEDSNRRVQTDKDYLAELDAQIAQAELNLQNAMTMGSTIYIKNTQKQIDTLKEKRNEHIKEMDAKQVARFTASLSGKTLEQLNAINEQLKKGNFQFEGALLDDKLYDSFYKAIDDAKKSLTTGPYYSEDYKAAKKEWEDAKKALDEIEKDKDKYTTKQYEAAKTRKETAEKKFKKLGGDTTGKGENTAKKEAREHNAKLAADEKAEREKERAEKEKVRTEKDNAFKVEQARIDAMAEGSAKVAAQRRLDNEREMEDLRRQKEDYIAAVVERERAAFEAQEAQKAQNDATYKKQAFDSAKVKAGVDTTTYDKVIGYTQEKQEDEVLNDLLEQYKSYEDKKQELTIAYLEETDALQAQYEETGDERFKRSLDERHKAYVKALAALEEEMGSADYKLIFGDPERMTRATIETALEKARAKMQSMDKEADPESFKALSEAIERLENARDNNPFQGWGNSISDVLQSLYKIRNIRKDIKKYEEEGNAEALEDAKSQEEKAAKDLKESLIGMGISTLGDTLSKAAASMREIADASGDVDLMNQAEALENAGSFVSSVGSGLATGGPIGAIVGGATALMDILISSITESKVVAAQAKKAYEDYIEELSQSKRQLNEEDYETIFGVRVIEKLQGAWQAASKAEADYYEALNRDSASWYSVKDWQHLAKNLSEMIVFEGKKQTDRNAKKSMTLAERFPELFDADGNIVKDQAHIILDTYSEYASEEWYETLEDAVSALEDYENNLKIVDNYLSSLFQNLGNDIADSILQGNDALESLQKSAGDIFKQIARQMVTEMLVSPDFIKEYTEKMRAAIGTEDYTDDADVVAEMTDELSANIEAAQKMWDDIQRVAEERGIDMSGDESLSQQEASRKGYQTLSEDTGNELVGRAVAQYESNLRMEEATRSMKESVDLMAARQVMIHDIAAESRALIADSYLELQQIRENTGAVIKPIQNLSAKIDKWDSKIMSL